MNLDVRVWAVDVSEFDLWTQGRLHDGAAEAEEKCGRGEKLIRNLIKNEEEQKKVQRYVREIDQIRSLTGKLLARLAVCSTFDDVQWHDLVFNTTPQGRPFVRFTQQGRTFDYNITHDGDWVAIAFSDKLVAPSLGVDVMEIQLPTFESNVQSFVETMDMTLTTAERDWILKASPVQTKVKHSIIEQRAPHALSLDDFSRLTRMYSLWTFKEAYTKAHGLGLSFDFAQVELAVWTRDDGEATERRVLVIDEKAKALETMRPCHFSEIALPPGAWHDKGHRQRRSTERAGRGTGQASLLVLAVLCQNDNQVDQLPTHTLTKIEAENAGLLRCFTMDELVRMATLQAGHGRSGR